MATFVFTSIGTIGMSAKTFGAAKRQVARILGSQGDPDAVGAGDAIHLAIDKLNMYEWDFLSVAGSDLTFTSNQATLPTPFLKPISLLIGDQALPFVRQGDWDHAWAANVGATPQAYTLFNHELSGAVRVLPGITDGSTAAIKYHRPIAKPNSDSELLDVLSRLERSVILEAQGQLLLEQGDALGKADRLLALAEVAMFTALGQDRGAPANEDSGFTPAHAWLGRNRSLEHAAYYIDGGD